MKTVNPYFLHVPLDPFTGLADDDDEVIKYSSFDICDEGSSKTLIRELVVPHVRKLRSESRVKIQDAYRYYLSKESSNWERVLDSILPPFNCSGNVRQFFVWIYEECFGATDYHIVDLEQWNVVVDVNEPLRVETSVGAPSGLDIER